MRSLAEVVERAARAGITFQLVRDGRVHCSPQPPNDLLLELRAQRDELTRRVRDWKCCWCLDTPRNAWFADQDSNLPICRKCVDPVGQARLDAEGFDITAAQVRAAGWAPEHFVGTCAGSSQEGSEQ